MKTSIFVVILSWNGRSDSLSCLASLAKVSSPPFRIILVDNGSSDGTAAAVREKYPAVEVIATGENLGFPGGNNVGIRRALAGRADYICLLNNDTEVDPAFLGEFLAAANRFPHGGIFGARVCYLERPKIVWSQGIAVNRLTGRVLTRHFNAPEDAVPAETTEARAVSAACMFVRREVFEKAGLMDERYFLCYEDVDLCLRAAAAGFTIHAVPAARVRHRVSASMGGEGSATIIYYSTRNQLLLARERLPLPLPLRAPRSLLIALYNLLFALVTTRTPARLGLPTWWRGVRNYLSGRFGRR
jgi:hypothetical protein